MNFTRTIDISCPVERSRPVDGQLTECLQDAHALEELALAQLRAAPQFERSPDLKQAIDHHLEETILHEEALRRHLQERHARPLMTKGTFAKLGASAFGIMAFAQPDTAIALLAHSYAFEHLQLAAYQLIKQLSRLADDEPTAQLAEQIAADEQRMAERLEALFSAVAGRALADLTNEQATDFLVARLGDAHAIEEQSIQLLHRAAESVDDEDLRSLCEDHQDESDAQRSAIEGSLQRHGARFSVLKDAMIRLGGLNWSVFFRAQPETAGKLAALAFAFENLEIASYAQLSILAEQLHDDAIATVARRILDQESRTAGALWRLLKQLTQVVPDEHAMNGSALQVM